jgi:hypothetical protein
MAIRSKRALDLSTQATTTLWKILLIFLPTPGFLHIQYSKEKFELDKKRKKKKETEPTVHEKTSRSGGGESCTETTRAKQETKKRDANNPLYNHYMYAINQEPLSWGRGDEVCNLFKYERERTR